MNEVRDLLVGLEIGREYSQIACYDRRLRDAVCVSTKAGTELFAFPTVLGKMRSSDEWHFGREAEYFAARQEGFLIDDLYGIFCSEQYTMVDGVRMEPWQLLVVFIRETLGLLGVNDVLNNIKGLMITTGELDRTFARNINRALRALFGSRSGFTAQDRLESFYYYCMDRNPESIRKNMCLLEMKEDKAQVHILDLDRETNPMTAEVITRPACTLAGDDVMRDAALLNYITRYIEDGKCGAVYITGTAFNQERFPMSTAFLCRGGRRVFAGDNLFVKGACFAVLEKTEKGRLGNILYLSDDLVRVNIGTDLVSDGEEAYYPIVTAGVNWFENNRTFELITGTKQGIMLTLTSMDGSRREYIPFLFDGLPERPADATRIRIEASCISGEECVITAEDRGFGGIYPATGKKWRIRIDLQHATNEGPAGWIASGRLCRLREADLAYPLEGVGISFTSIEELCFFLYRYPELLDGELVCGALADWVGEELGLASTAQAMHAALRGGEDLYAFIQPVFRAAGYLTEQEKKDYRRKIAALMKERVIVRMKKKGDALAGYGKYISAMGAYKKALGMADEKTEDPVFLAALYHNMGCVYMRMLLYEESLDSFKKAYIRFHTKDALRTYLTAAAVARPRSRYEEILRTMHVDSEMKESIDRAILHAMQKKEERDIRNPEEIVDSLIAEYRNAAGMPSA